MAGAGTIAALLLLVTANARAADWVHWYTLSSDGTRTGYVREERGEGADGSVHLSERMVIVVRQLGRTSRIERRVALRRAADGAPLEYDYLLSSGTVHENWHGVFAGNVLHVRPAGGTPQRVALPDDTQFTPDRGERLAQLWRTAQTSATLTVFDPARRSAGPLRVRRVDDTDDGLVHWHEGGANESGEDLWFDASGTLQRLDTHLLGAALRWEPCAAECEADVAAPMQAMQHLVVRSPVEIPEWGRHRTLRYVIARADGARPQLAATPEQDVVYDGAHAVLTICDDCGAAETPAPEQLARYTASNAWVRSDAPQIRGLALSTVQRGARTDYRMRKLVNAVMRHMRGSSDLLGYADAVTALRSGGGDCTEFAVLLAALARAQGIPTRLVAGLAYSDRFSGRKDVFAPHMWVQAWDGTRWKSYDAALDDFDATHIALAIGSGAPEEFERVLAQLPQLRIEKAAIVRAP
jgi:transglutaminase-like putative cysteine protease